MTGNAEEMVRRAKAGDRSALEALISANEKRLYNFIYRLTGDPDDAADLTQETFLRVCTSIRYFRGDASFVSWLYRIASNVCVDRARRRARRQTLSLDAPVVLEDGECSWVLRDRSPEPGDLAEQTEVREVVRLAIATLPSDYRTVVVLHDLQDLSYREIADVVGCPIGTVKSRLNRGRSALRKRLMSADGWHFEDDWGIGLNPPQAPELLPAS
ncbi:MAG: sigma-70 family RNA polymerase sigma factor [Firmicutes bacterium]|nr:sigma-70 family RNA polymerase sigma factor [Bacillota bacterium]